MWAISPSAPRGPPTDFDPGLLARLSKISARMADELWALSAGDLALRIAQGECSALEAVEAHIGRIESVNRSLNAVVAPRFDEARSEARTADRARADGQPLGRLHGVPITIKESLDVAGLPTTLGLRSRARTIAQRDDPYVARLRACGAIVLGKTNVSQLTFFIESDNPLYGRTNNPWNLKRSPGGSSGGQAAIVAAGGSPFGLGTDLGGSIRVPASFCGIAGMKPTAGRCPEPSPAGLLAGETSVVSQTGVLARDVADVILAIDCINGGRNPSVEPPRPLGDPYAVDVAGLRIGYYQRAGWLEPAPAVARAVEEAAGVLHQIGARVVPFSPPYPDHAEDLFYGILSADGGAGAIALLGRDKRDKRIAELLGIASKPRRSIERTMAFLKFTGQRNLARLIDNYGRTGTAHYWRLTAALDEYRKHFLETLDLAEGGPIDVLLGPACALPALPHGESRHIATAGAYALMYNVLGYPAGVVPVTRVGANEQIGRKRSRDGMERSALRTETESVGLPVGVQVIARPWREHVAFAVMLAIESAVKKRADFPRTPVDVA
jgi:fatty acid amide hydrolase